jgi:hypothetical protein
LANRFDKTYDQQPWVSSYVPLPLKEIEAGYAKQQDTYDKGMAALADKPIITGGPTTQDHAKMLRNQVEADTKAMADEAEKTHDYGQLTYKMKNYANRLKENPIYQAVKEDETLGTALANDVMMQSGNENYVQWFYDPKSKDLKQQDINKIPSLSHYKTKKPGDYWKDFGDVLGKIHEETDISMNMPELVPFKDDFGNISYKNIQTGKETTGITRDQIKERVALYVKNNKNVWGKESVNYDKAVREEIEKGVFTEDDVINNITDAYLGTYQSKKDIQKENAVPANKSGSGNKKSGDDDDVAGNYDNKLLNIIKESSVNGGAVIDTGDVAAFLGGTKDTKTGTTLINATGRTLYFSVGKQGTQKEVEDDVKMGKAIPFKVKENALIKKYHNTILSDIVFDKEDAINNPVSTFATGGGNTGKPYRELVYWGGNLSKNFKNENEKTIREYDSATGKTRSISINELKNTEFYKAELASFKANDPNGYGVLKSEAERAGIDLDDKDLNEKIKGNNLENYETLDNLNTALTNINGQLEVIPGSGKSFFTDNNGDPVVKIDAFVTEVQMKNIAPAGIMSFMSADGYKKLEEDGLIKKHTKTIVKDNGEVAEVKGYIMSMVTPAIGLDAETTTRNIDVNQWGNAQWVAKNVQHNTSEVKDELFKIKVEKQIIKFQKEFAKNPDKYITDWDYQFNQFLDGKLKDPDGNLISRPNISDDQRGKLNAAKVAILDDKNMSKEDKAKSLFIIKMKLTDPAGYNLMFPGGDNVGKQTAQGTSADPLGMK